VGEKKASESEAESRLAALRDRVERATKLIAELREANYSLTGEIAELHRKLGALPPTPPASPPTSVSSPAAPTGVHEELQLLRDERKIIRAKVQNLLERIERIDF
jgi:predicted nuclease with TOPRIM domain